MRNYRAYYRGRTFDVQAPNSFQAQEVAARMLKIKRTWQVAVVLLDVPLDTTTI
jgi:hypothetical protein